MNPIAENIKQRLSLRKPLQEALDILTHLSDELEMKKLPFINEEGHLIDKSGELICFDPSVNFTAPAGLLIRTDKLEGWLKENQYALVWDVVGQKQILGNNFKKGDYPGSLHFEGLYNMDKKFKIQGTLRYSER